MMNNHIHAEREWVVGGYEVDPLDTEAWRQWRDILVAKELERQVWEAVNECIAISEGLIGGTDTPEGFNARLLMEEAAVNMYGHGKKGSPKKPSTIALKVEELHPDRSLRFTLSMQDDLPELDIENLPDPTFDERLEELTGRGILIIRKQCRAKIMQVSLDEGGKHMIYEWKHPKYTLRELGFDEDEYPSNAGVVKTSVLG